MHTELEVRPPSDSISVLEDPATQPAKAAIDDVIGADEIRWQWQQYSAASNIVRAVHDGTTTIIIPEGVPKAGARTLRDPDAPKGPTFLPAVAGKIIDSALKDLERTPAERRRLRRQRHKDMPPEVLGWALQADEIAPQIMERLRRSASYNAEGAPQVVVEELQQARIFASEDAEWSAMVLQAGLLYEQEKGDGTPGPFEQALRLSPALNPSGRRKAGFNKTLQELPDDFPLTQQEIKGHLRNVWSYHFTEDGNLIVCPTVQPDVILLLCKEEDLAAEDGLAIRHAAAALAEVLRAGVGYDANTLNEMSFRFRRPDPKIEDSVDGLTAVHWALRYICEGKISLQVADAKALTHAGMLGQVLERYWEDGGDIGKVLSDENLSSKDPKFRALQQHFGEYAQDLSRTVYAFASWLQFVEREFQSKNRDVGEPAPQRRAVVAAIGALLAAVDFNIMKSKEELAKIRSDSDRKPPHHNTIPPEDEIKVPEQVSVVVKEITPGLVRKHVKGRGSEIRTQRKDYERRRLAKLALKFAKATAGVDPVVLSDIINA